MAMIMTRGKARTHQVSWRHNGGIGCAVSVVVMCHLAEIGCRKRFCGMCQAAPRMPHGRAWSTELREVWIVDFLRGQPGDSWQFRQARHGVPGTDVAAGVLPD